MDKDAAFVMVGPGGVLEVVRGALALSCNSRKEMTVPEELGLLFCVD